MSVCTATRCAHWNLFARFSSGFRLQARKEQDGRPPPRRFGSGDGEGTELFMAKGLMKGIASATIKADVPSPNIGSVQPVNSAIRAGMCEL